MHLPFWKGRIPHCHSFLFKPGVSPRTTRFRGICRGFWLFESSTARLRFSEMDETYETLSSQAYNHILRQAPRQSDLSILFDIDPDRFLQGLPSLRTRLESHFVREQMHRIHKRIDVIEFYNTYAIAQDNPNAFLQLTAKKVFGNSSRNVAPRKGRKDSM